MDVDHSILIGGEAGQGLQTVGEVLSKTLARAGFNVFTSQDYESRIRGGHNTYTVRFSGSPITALAEGTDVLVALDRKSIQVELDGLKDGAIVLYDSQSLGGEKFGGPDFIDVPFRKLAESEGGSPLMSNTVAVGALIGIIGMETSVTEALLSEIFAKKGPDVVEKNINALKAGCEYVKKNCPGCAISGVKADGVGKKMLINTTQAISLGALASGVRFYSAYPMTPSTGIMVNLAARAREFGVVVEQAEDEISAINMALGASFAGVRAMTGTSGGGFALMVEGLSLAGMTETPIVIAEGQRPGPATGLPTRTEQGDLLFILHAGHGEFPRIILAPGSPREAFYLTNRAFELTEKYQVPVFVLFDTYLGDSQWTYDDFDTDSLIYNDYRLRGDVFRALKDYKRHAITETGVTPLGVPGDATHLVVTDSDEHDEDGHIVEDAATRIRMTEKRLFKKMRLIKKEMNQPLLYGSEQPDVVLAGWGSTYGVIKEAVDVLMKDRKAAMLHFSELFPFPENTGFFLDTLKGARTAIMVENNATGQFARLMRAETGFVFDASINRYDGRPFTVQGLLREIDAVI